MSNKIHINQEDDDVDDVCTDSENEYSEEEKELLEEVRTSYRKEKSQKNEIMTFNESDEENNLNDDDLGLHDSDIEGAEQNDDDLPDTKYWGKSSRNYYNTDFIDQDYTSYNEREEELAEFEADEAKSIQQRLVKELKEEDFLLDATTSTSKDQADDRKLEDSETVPLISDFSGLTKRERLQLFEKDSPEFAGIVGDLEGYLEEMQNIHNPVLEYVVNNNLPMIPALKFAKFYQNLALTYCNNLMFYLLLKAKRVSIQNHPIVQRLNQMKKLLKKLADKHENIIKPQLEALLERIEDGDVFEVLEVQPELHKLEVNNCKKNTSVNRVNQQGMETDLESNDSNENNLNEGDDHEEENPGDEILRRGITYQMAKNKGLTPHRKKELRNPRVKHRSKYRKALIRRKGAVRTVRKESTRYSGEISGIKATVSKSIKFKS
uniref:Sas10 C-terminal domain-containing protein n=1 Tax=Glossina palpalis gambiensis TaxID=67801 RepID=A0A1B0B8I4_9MUSC